MIENANAIVQHVIQNKNWNNKTCKCESKKYHKHEKDYSWNRSICICENKKYLKGVVNTSMTKGDETVIVLNNWSTKKTNTITANVSSTALINWYGKKVRDYYILHADLLIMITLLTAVSICCYLIQHRTKHLLPFHK